VRTLPSRIILYFFCYSLLIEGDRTRTSRVRRTARPLDRCTPFGVTMPDNGVNYSTMAQDGWNGRISLPPFLDQRKARCHATLASITNSQTPPPHNHFPSAPPTLASLHFIASNQDATSYIRLTCDRCSVPDEPVTGVNTVSYPIYTQPSSPKIKHEVGDYRRLEPMLRMLGSVPPLLDARMGSSRVAC
jgi:hypothetical protein